MNEFLHSNSPMVAELIEAMGLKPEYISRMVLDFNVHEAVTITVYGFLTKANTSDLTSFIRKYRLVEHEILEEAVT